MQREERGRKKEEGEEGARERKTKIEVRRERVRGGRKVGHITSRAFARRWESGDLTRYRPQCSINRHAISRLW